MKIDNDEINRQYVSMEIVKELNFNDENQDIIKLLALIAINTGCIADGIVELYERLSSMNY